MSIFDEISGLMSGGGGLSDAGKGNIGNALTGVLQSQGINGISGLVQRFEQSGLGAQASSWVGNGANQPVSAGHIEQALGPNVLGAIAGHFGIDPGQASQMLSQHLPGIVDHMTPNGTASGNDESEDADSNDTNSDDDTLQV
jgi:uncharacterized protein YidB (DUF937 family)